MTFGQRLRQLREDRGIGLRELSRLSGLSLSHLHYLERDEKQPGDERLAAYLKDLPGLRAQYERARVLERIPVTLPDGSAVALTPGGQSVLIKDMVEEFCSRFTPGGQVLYVGDAGKDDPVFDAEGL